MKPKIVYVAHSIGGNVQENLKDLVRILRIINLDIHPNRFIKVIDTTGNFRDFNFKNIVPIAPYYADIIALDDNVPEERARGIANDIEIIKTGIFQELWLT